jgi:hypothetical protein
MTLRSRRLANRQLRLKGRETEACPGTASTITDDAHRVRLLALTEWLRLVATALPIHSHDAPAPSSPATKQPVRRRSRTTRRASQREPHPARHKTAANRRRRRPSDAKCGRNAPDDRGGGRSTPGRAVDAQQDQDATRRVPQPPRIGRCYRSRCTSASKQIRPGFAAISQSQCAVLDVRMHGDRPAGPSLEGASLVATRHDTANRSLTLGVASR